MLSVKFLLFSELMRRIPYCLSISIGVAGVVLSLVWSIQGIDYKGSFLLAIVSMALVALGSSGLQLLKRREP